jgi:chromosome segregation protein
LFLRRLDLVGFKSFASRTSTELQPGIVVVVGPNGSGKSNVSDAVLWVLGEQSAKAVRARKPEEVIFAGSASRQPLGMAEVSLVLDNADGSLPIDFQEVRVTRRLYRSGDSEYLLNGSKVRLKDITQLLLHAGLSPDSYTVVGQGSIDELILQRPDERRVAFENVADIRRHQLRLNDTRSKLSSTQANLVRVQDILAELTPHVRRLKGQADRAERAESFRTELHGLLLRSFRWRLARAHADRRQAEADLNDATAMAHQAEAETQAGDQSLRAHEERIAALEERVAELRPRADVFREQVRAAERSLAVARERRAGLAEQRIAAEAEVLRLQGLLERLAEDAQEAAHQVGQAPQASDTEDDAQRLEVLQAQLSDELAAFSATQAERAALQTSIEAAERRLRDAEAELVGAEQHLQSLRANVAIDRARLGDRETRMAAIHERLASLESEHAELDEQVSRARERLDAVTAAQTVAGSHLEEARERLRLASQQADRLHGALAALGASDLHRRDDADLPPEWQTALDGLPVIGLAGELASRIPPIDVLLASYARRIVVLADNDAAHEAHRRLSSALTTATPAWAVLSMDGLLIASAGVRPLEPTAGAGQSTLADWTRQVRQLEFEREAAEAERKAALADVQAARDSLDDAEADERGARVMLGGVEARLAELTRAELAARSEIQELQAAYGRSERALSQHADEQVRAAERARAAHEALAQAGQAHADISEELKALNEKITAVDHRVRQARTELVALEAVAGRRDAEREAREALAARIQSEIASTDAAREATSARLFQLADQEAELAEREAQLEREIQGMQAELEPVDAELELADQRRAELVAERLVIEQQIAVLRAAERAAHETREARHVAAQRAVDDVERLRVEIAETAELQAETTGEAAWAEQLRLEFDGPAVAVEAFDLEAARRRIATLQRELRAIGGVAESVIDEYRELSERHGFLEQQSADLKAAMSELESAAVELETHMRERFGEAFAAIQAAFQDCFSRLFGGGEARLVLTEPDDLLRTGIDIVARPPGKKLQGLLSLSGGERALTIVSLLFGLLKINPTPFCVLDEVDAALDEANVQRFANLLDEFARGIQFIVVTHNRATMDKADAMYGVSMDAAGISHIFSVRPRDMADERARPDAEPVAVGVPAGEHDSDT